LKSAMELRETEIGTLIERVRPHALHNEIERPEQETPEESEIHFLAVTINWIREPHGSGPGFKRTDAQPARRNEITRDLPLPSGPKNAVRRNQLKQPHGDERGENDRCGYQYRAPRLHSCDDRHLRFLEHGHPLYSATSLVVIGN